MDFIQNLIDQSAYPLFTAFLLGIMTAISPCPLATNITAMAYLGRDVQDRRRVFFNGLLYTLGRAISYTLVGSVVFLGVAKFHVSRAVQSNGEKWIGPLLVAIGVSMLIASSFPSASGNRLQRLADRVKLNKGWGALILGALFALAFCPYSGVLFFGMLLPLALSHQAGLLLLPVFALATGLPVILLAYLLAFSIGSIGVFYDKIKVLEVWMRRIVAGLFVLTGLYFVWIFFF